MNKQFFAMPVDITSYAFDRRGRGVPTRINWRGKTYSVNQLENSSMVSICDKGSYFWLEKSGRTWRFFNSDIR